MSEKYQKHSDLFFHEEAYQAVKKHKRFIADKKLRTPCVVTGIILQILAIPIDFTFWTPFFWWTGIGFMLYGCYLWTRLKNRHWALLFLGLWPLGFLILYALEDKSRGAIKS